MAIVNSSVIEQFEVLTKFNLASLLLDYSQFITRLRSSIIDYYAGLSRRPNEMAFRELERLIGEFDRLNNVLENNRDRLSHTLYWELIESLSDMQTQLETVDNASRWLRSAITRNDFSPGIEIEHTLRQFQTLEEVARTVQGSSNQQNEWVTIALRNDLIEEGYTTSGGNRLELGLRNRATIQIRSVVDTINGESVYGKDLDRTLKFDSDGDLTVLTPQNTIRQSVNILGGLTQGDNPEFRGQGIQGGLVVGGNRASIAYPIIFRQIFSTFQRDDTLRAIRVTDISNREDSIFITVEVETRFDEVITTEVQMS